MARTQDSASERPAARQRRAGAPPFRAAMIRFGGLLVFWVVGFNIAYYWFITGSRAFYAFVDLQARVAAALLRVMGAEVTVANAHIASTDFSLQISHGCDAMQPLAFYVFAVLCSPVAVRWTHRLAVVIVGAVALLLLNLFRIVTLYFAGVYAPSFFETLHIDIWQAIFVFVPLLMWIGWVLRVRTENPANDPGR